MTIFLQDLRYAWRVLRKEPLNNGIAVATLALGIGATTAIFSVVNAALLTPPPGIHNPDALVTIGRTVDGRGFDNSSYPNYADLRDQNRVFTDVAAVKPAPLSLRAGGHAERLSGAVVTANYFRTAGVSFAIGRGFDPATPDRQSGPAVAVISHAVWQQRFGRDPAVIGASVSLNSVTFEIIGVTAPGFRGVDATGPQDVWVPVATIARLAVLAPSFRENDTYLQNRGGVWIMLYARRKPGVTPAQARADVETIAERLRSHPENAKNGWTMAEGVGLTPDDRRELTRVTSMLFGAVGILLLLACANAANLSLARAATRVHEVSVRLAIGASRGRLVRQLLTESLVLAALGGAAGLIVAEAATDWTAAIFARSARLALAVDLSPDARVIVFAGAVSGLSAVLFGLWPAVRAAGVDLVPALKEAVALAPRQSRVRRGLVVVQLTLSVVLMIAAGLLLRTIRAFNAIETGVDARNVVIGTVEPSITGKYDEARLRRFYAELLPRLQAVPGVEAATLGRIAPVTPRGYGLAATVLDKPGSFTESRGLQFNTVATNYFEVLGIPVVRGRGFKPSDTTGSMPVVVINDVAVRRLWPDEDPVGKQILVRGEPVPRAIVGVVGTIKYRNLIETPYPLAYYPLSQPVPMPDAPVVIHVRSTLPVPRLAAALGDEVHAIDADLPIFDVKRLSDHMADSYWRQQIAGVFTTALAIIALALGSIGMYGVMAFAAEERTREIGLRMALGATSPRVVGMFVGDAARLIAGAAAAGIVLAVFFSRLVSALLLGVDPRDPLTFAVATMVLAGAGLLAATAPAVRASRVDPMAALRRD